MADKHPTPVASPGEPIDLSESVAGEEDPGASVDMAATPESSSDASAMPSMAPGDQAPRGTEGTGETVCPQCGGSGRQGASSCANCQGTGKVNVGIGGA